MVKNVSVGSIDQLLKKLADKPLKCLVFKVIMAENTTVLLIFVEMLEVSYGDLYDNVKHCLSVSDILIGTGNWEMETSLYYCQICSVLSSYLKKHGASLC